MEIYVKLLLFFIFSHSFWFFTQASNFTRITQITQILHVSQLQTHQVMTSHIRSYTQYLNIFWCLFYIQNL